MKNFLKFKYISIFKHLLVLFFLLFLLVAVSAISYASQVSSDISNSIFRLHVIANSNSIEDQNLKYLVRDSLLKYMNELTRDITSKEQIINIVKEHSNDFSRIAKQTILDNGYNYDVTIEIGNFSFPTKTYGDISFPSGFYDALKVKIGNASGQNWWCVMFPPLCFVDIDSGIVSESSKEIIQNSLSSEEYLLISEPTNNNIADTGLTFKFKLLELFQNAKLLTAKN